MNKILRAIDTLLMPDGSIREVNRKVEEYVLHAPLESLNTPYISYLYGKANIVDFSKKIMYALSIGLVGSQKIPPAIEAIKNYL